MAQHALAGDEALEPLDGYAPDATEVLRLGQVVFSTNGGARSIRRLNGLIVRNLLICS